MELFDVATMKALRKHGDELTGTFENLLITRLKEKIEVISPIGERGSMLCLKFKNDPKKWAHKLREKDVYVDFREPDIIRATPTPLYNSFSDVYRLVEIFEEVTN